MLPNSRESNYIDSLLTAFEYWHPCLQHVHMMVSAYDISSNVSLSRLFSLPECYHSSELHILNCASFFTSSNGDVIFLVLLSKEGIFAPFLWPFMGIKLHAEASLNLHYLKIFLHRPKFRCS